LLKKRLFTPAGLARPYARAAVRGEIAMPSAPASGKSTAIPCLRYHDVAGAIAWLCRNFGFDRQEIFTGEGGKVVHAQLVLGGGMVMLGPVDNVQSQYGRLIKHPDQIGGFETQSPYLVVADVDAVYGKVKADGGQIVIDIKDEEYGGRGFTCRDLEGRLWSVASYDPWAS
jgi:uncharacterized glyoxalase superfamily protein PhnB